MQSEMFYSSRDLMMAMIEAYRELPCLWKVKDPYYRDKHARNAALEQLLEVFRKFDPNATKGLVTKKLNSMRGSFRKELNKVRVSKEEGRPDKLHIPKLWYYDHLRFLVDQEPVTPSKSVFDDMHLYEVDICEGERDEETESDAETSSAPNSRPTTPIKSLERSRCKVEVPDSNDSNPPSKRSNDVYAGVDCVEGDIFYGIEISKDSERSITNGEFAIEDHVLDDDAPSKMSVSNNNNSNKKPAVVYLEGKKMEKHNEPKDGNSVVDQALDASITKPYKRPYKRRMPVIETGKPDQSAADPPAKRSLASEHASFGCSEDRPRSEKYGSFGEHVTEKLRDMPPEMVPYCQKLICDAIFYAEMRSLNITSRIVTEHGPSGPGEHYHQALLPNVSTSLRKSR